MMFCKSLGNAIFTYFPMSRCFWGLEHFGDSGENADGFALAAFLGVGVFVVFGLIFGAVTHDLVPGLNRIY